MICHTLRCIFPCIDEACDISQTFRSTMHAQVNLKKRYLRVLTHMRLLSHKTPLISGYQHRKGTTSLTCQCTKKKFSSALNHRLSRRGAHKDLCQFTTCMHSITLPKPSRSPKALGCSDPSTDGGASVPRLTLTGRVTAISLLCRKAL